MNPTLFLSALAHFKKYSDKSWGLVDCVSFIVMQQKGIAHALTADRHFEQVGFIAMMRQ